MTQFVSREDAKVDWWAGWWSADYSWEGLATKRWTGRFLLPSGEVVDGNPELDGGTVYEDALPATLQDYWRDLEAHLIVAPDGARFSPVHLPPRWRDGTLTGKESWPDDTLDSVIASKVVAAYQSEFTWDDDGHRVPIGPDNRAQLQGTILLRAPSTSAQPLCATFESSAFLRTADFHTASFAADTSFRKCLFEDTASFDSASFPMSVDFEHALFFQPSTFVEVTFAWVNFSDAVFFAYVHFNRSTFENALFFTTLFKEDHEFSGASFHEAIFKSAFFEEAIFDSRVSFGSCEFQGEGSFHSAEFHSEADFAQAHFTNSARFLNCRFNRETSFFQAKFDGRAEFSQAYFEGETSFHGAVFSGAAIFLGGKAKGTIHFIEAQFEASAQFHTREFDALVYFDAAVFLGEMTFAGAVFERLASFERIRWPITPSHWHRAFDKTFFRSTVVFTGAGFKALAAFDGATLERGISLDEVSASRSDEIFHSELVGAIGTVSEDDKSHQARDARLAELERGCRVLKQAMEKASNKTREQMFYRYELVSRRRQSTTPLTEKVLSKLYHWTANYGSSIGRPFVSLAILIVSFAYLYYAISVGSFAVAPWSPEWHEAMSFSASRVFPFGAFEDVSKAWIEDFESKDSLATFGLRVLASAQSVVALALVFAFGLSVRRKFQMT